MGTWPGSYRRSFWLRKPSFIFSTTLASMELASLAKSRSRISDTGTDTMAKASLSSLVGQVPSWKEIENPAFPHLLEPQHKHLLLGQIHAAASPQHATGQGRVQFFSPACHEHCSIFVASGVGRSEPP